MDKSVVVTGCGTGIGRAIFSRLLNDGWAVVGIDMQPALAEAARQEAGDRGFVITGDVADLDTLEEAATQAQALAPLRGWVNNAGLAIRGNLHEPDPAGVERLFKVNLYAPYWGCSIAVRRFLGQRSGGAIVNISSIHSTASFPGWAAYDTAKGGIDALTRYVAVEYGPVGIRANAIAPGAIDTPLNVKVIAEAADPAALAKSYSDLHPLSRQGKPEEIAAATAFLLSEEASFISGQVLAVDGGATARCFYYPPDDQFVAKYKPEIPA